MSLRRRLPSANALFFFEAAARTGSFTRAAAELNVTQPAVSRMLTRLEEHLGVDLFRRSATGMVLTEEGLLLQRPLAEAFRAIETGLDALESRRTGVEPVTLSVSSGFTTHWLMPRIDKLRRAFPSVDLRFQLIAGSLRGPVDTVDLGMRFTRNGGEGDLPALVMREAMIPVCSPAYLERHAGDEPITVINLADAPTDWAAEHEDLVALSALPMQALHFSDYAVVIQAALLGQGVALGWLTVASRWLLTGDLVPASRKVVTTGRRCEFLMPRSRPVRPIVREVRDWIIDEMRTDIDAIDRAFPELGLHEAAFGA